jgi:hypothetical protein
MNDDAMNDDAMNDDLSVAPVPYEAWHISLDQGAMTLSAAYRSLRGVGLRQEQIPFIVQLIENPRYDVPLIDMFPGATDLATHDYIHIILGRGLLPKDEAFVLGFTMGSTNRMSATEEKLYEVFARYLYPKSYRFGDDEAQVFRDAVRLGYISDCMPLSEIDYTRFEDYTITAARNALGVEEDLLRAYYAIERRRYPNAAESQRL